MKRSVLGRKLLRDLWWQRGLVLSIAAIVVLGTNSFCTMVSLHGNLSRARDDYYRSCRLADFWVILKRMPRGELERIRRAARVPELQGRIVFDITARIPVPFARRSPDAPGSLPAADVPQSPQATDLGRMPKRAPQPPRVRRRWISGQIVSIDPRAVLAAGRAAARSAFARGGGPAPRRTPLNSVLLRRGWSFTPDGRREVLVDDAFARRNRIRPGDRVELLLNEQLYDVTVAGTVQSPEFVYLLPPGGLIPDPEQFGVFFARRELLEEAFDFGAACNQLVGRLAPQQNPDEVLESIEELCRDYGVIDTIPRRRWLSNWFLSNELRGLRVTTYFLPTAFLLVAALLLDVLMMRLVRQQRTTIGTLKALGYSDARVVRHYLAFAVFIGGLGGAVGVAVAFGVAERLTAVYRQFFEFPRLENRFSATIALTSMAVTCCFALFGGWRGARSVVRLQPAEAMRPAPAEMVRPGPLLRAVAGARRVPLGWRLALRNLLRHRGRSLIGMFAAAVGTALMIMALSSRDAMNELMDLQFSRLILADAEFVLKDTADTEAARSLQRFARTERAESVFTLPCTLAAGHRSKRIAVTAIDPQARLIVPRDAAGNPVSIPGRGLLLSEHLARILNVRIGQFVRLIPSIGDRTPRRVRVCGLVRSYVGLTAYANRQWLTRLLGESGAVSNVAVRFPRGGGGQPELPGVGRFANLQSVNAIRQQRRKLQETLIEQMQVSISVLIAFAGLVFLGSALNMSLIALSERRREVATLWAVGYFDAEIGGIFLRETLVINALGVLAGIPLGYWATFGMTRLYDTELFRMPFVVYPQSVAVTALAAGVFTVLAHVPVARAIRRNGKLESLNVRE